MPCLFPCVVIAYIKNMQECRYIWPLVWNEPVYIYLIQPFEMGYFPYQNSEETSTELEIHCKIAHIC